VGIAVGFLVGFVLVVSRAPRYDSETRVLVDAPRPVDISTSPDVLLRLSLMRFKYAALATTAVIAQPVGQRLGLGERHVANGVTASAAQPSFVLSIVGQDQRPEVARRLSDAVATELSAYADREQEAAGLAPDARYQLRVVSPAQPASRDTKALKDAAKSSFAAAGVGFLIAYLAPSARRRNP
jgi:capsular polysaccharide biosynthesis protein